MLPRFDISLPIDIAGWRIEPSAMWQTQEYDQTTNAGDDDDIDLWAVGLHVKGGVGPFVFGTEWWVGENLGNGAGPSVGTPFSDPLGARNAMAYVETGTGLNRMADADLWGFWIEAGIKFGPARLMLVYGYQEMDNDVNPTTTADDIDWEAQMYGIYCPISVAKGFTITPEILIADFDSGALTGAGTGITSDYGDMFQVGVMFRLAF